MAAWDYYSTWTDEDRPDDYESWGPWKQSLWPLCHWGCGIFSCVDCADQQAPVIRFHAEDYDPEGSFGDLFVRESNGIQQWLEAWLTSSDRNSPPKPD